MAGKKIAMIGGGSAFSPVFLNAIAEKADSFRGSQVVLMDINSENLALIHTLGLKMFQAVGAEIELVRTTDRVTAIDSADFVITSYRPGGFIARALDEKIPLKYGIIGQETVGPGGFFMGLRSMKIMRDILREIEKTAPNAFLLNYTNPTNILTEAVTHYSPVKIIGMCDQSQGDKRRMAHALGVDVERVYYEAYGLNHAAWSSIFEIDGKDGIPLVLEQADRVLADPQTPAPVKRMFRLTQWYGRIPNRYMQYYYMHEEMVAEANASSKSRAEVIMDELPGYLTHYREESQKDVPDLQKMRGGSKAFGDFAVEVMHAIATDSNHVFILNVPNKGALPGFEADRVVEVPCLVNRFGAQPIAQQPLPDNVAGLIQMLAYYQALAAEAAWMPDRKIGVMALASNPLVQSIEVAEKLFDELAAAHREYLPESLN